MITISLCMIVKNEEDVLARCLSSVQDAVDEIIIVDTGSNDNTKEIARQFTPNVYSFLWVNDFSKARNSAYAHASMDYQMWLDADDIILPEELEKLKRLKETLSPDVDIVTMKYNTHFDENGNPVLTSCRERLTKRQKGYLWMDPVHECIPLIGNVLHTDITITHKKEKHEGTSDRNILIYENLERQGIAFSPRQLYYFARELQDHGNWEKSVIYYEKFLDTRQGWSEDNIAACLNLSKCYEQLGQKNKILPVLYRSFLYDTPRAEICCAIGYYFKGYEDFQSACDWFHIAYTLRENRSLGFILRDYWDYIPALELCVCYDRLGEHQKAFRYNEEAAKYKPEAEAIQLNRDYFAANGISG